METKKIIYLPLTLGCVQKGEPEVGRLIIKDLLGYYANPNDTSMHPDHAAELKHIWEHGDNELRRC